MGRTPTDPTDAECKSSLLLHINGLLTVLDAGTGTVSPDCEKTYQALVEIAEALRAGHGWKPYKAQGAEVINALHAIESEQGGEKPLTLN